MSAARDRRLHRLFAMLAKEFTHMLRDRLTLGMMVGIPVLQLILFGYAINTDPRHLPTALFAPQSGPHVRAIVSALENTRYFRITRRIGDAHEIERAFRRGEIVFAVTIPADFERRLVHDGRAQILVEADATDPVAVSGAIAALPELARRAATGLRSEQGRALAAARPAPAVDVVVHRRYNPEALTELNIVPALIGVVLTMTMVIITALAVTRERERGTMEALLATPLTPFEIMVGKTLPYILVGAVQTVAILVAARELFGVTVTGSPLALVAALAVFMLANLLVGYSFSTLARNQVQAVQMSFFFFLPSLLLSGFMFPFHGMPRWAQTLGEVFPLTHFVRIVRSVLLKGGGLADIAPEIGAIALFLVAAALLALARFRRTLD